MQTHADTAHQSQSNAVANNLAIQQNGGEEMLQPGDQENLTQNKLQEAADSSSQVMQGKLLQSMANNSLQVKQLKAVQFMMGSVKQHTALTSPQQGRHVAQRRYAHAMTVNNRPIQKKTSGRDVFFRQEISDRSGQTTQRMSVDGMAHVSSPGVVQRATFQIPTVDYDPQGDQKYDYDFDNAAASAILTSTRAAISASKAKNYVQTAINALKDSDDNIVSTDIPLLITDIYNNIEQRYVAANNNKIGAMAQKEKADLKAKITEKLNAFMKDERFGHGLQSKASKSDFNKLLTVSTTQSQSKGTASTISTAALNGFDAGAVAAATSVATNFAAIKGNNLPGATDAEREEQYSKDLDSLPSAGRGVHYNVAGWLPPLPRPAVEPWKAAAPDHARSSALLWFISEGAPSIYLEFNGGQKASRIVYDPIHNISYATMHYASLGGYNPFFQIV